MLFHPNISKEIIITHEYSSTFLIKVSKLFCSSYIDTIPRYISHIIVEDIIINYYVALSSHVVIWTINSNCPSKHSYILVKSIFVENDASLVSRNINDTENFYLLEYIIQIRGEIEATIHKELWLPCIWITNFESILELFFLHKSSNRSLCFYIVRWHVNFRNVNHIFIKIASLKLNWTLKIFNIQDDPFMVKLWHINPIILIHPLLILFTLEILSHSSLICNPIYLKKIWILN